jgi:hypothetical protein
MEELEPTWIGLSKKTVTIEFRVEIQIDLRDRWCRYERQEQGSYMQCHRALDQP